MNVDMEDVLQSNESLDRASPDLWPDHQHQRQHPPQQPHSQNGRSFSDSLARADVQERLLPSPTLPSDQLTQQDAKLFHEYANLTPTQMIEEVKQLQNVAYLLGLDEAKEMRRGKYLNILRRGS